MYCTVLIKSTSILPFYFPPFRFITTIATLALTEGSITQKEQVEANSIVEPVLIPITLKYKNKKQPPNKRAIFTK